MNLLLRLNQMNTCLSDHSPLVTECDHTDIPRARNDGSLRLLVEHGLPLLHHPLLDLALGLLHTLTIELPHCHHLREERRRRRRRRRRREERRERIRMREVATYAPHITNTLGNIAQSLKGRKEEGRG